MGNGKQPGKMKLVVGLGNPGRRYALTRHNIGFRVLDEMARRAGVRFRKVWLRPIQTACVSMGGQDVMLVKPLTFMNRSGVGLRALVRRYGLGPEDVIVVLDDLDLEVSRLRIRKKGSAGGHKGLASVLSALGTESVPRVRVGIGPRPVKEDLTHYVLGRFRPEEAEAVEKTIQRAADAVSCMIQEGIETAMNRYN